MAPTLETAPAATSRTRVFAVVPARDEAEHVAEVARTMPASIERTVVVDDASTDGTAELARAADPRVRVVRHARRRGVGAALASGYRAAFEDGADVVVVLAGDGQMDPADLGALLAVVGPPGAAHYVKGTRLRRAAVLRSMPPARLVGNVVWSAVTRLATGLPITDSQCGYTAMTRAAAARLDLPSVWRGYGYPNDLLARCAARGVRVSEVDVRAVYRGEKSGLRLRHALLTIPYVIATAGFRS